MSEYVNKHPTKFKDLHLKGCNNQSHLDIVPPPPEINILGYKVKNLEKQFPKNI